jgi:hypothetical protein
MAMGFGALVGVGAAFLLFVAYVSEGWLPALLGFGLVWVIILSVAFASLADAYLTTTFVLVARDRVVVRIVRYRKERIQEYALDKQSRARHWYLPPRPGRHVKPLGIEIGPKAGDPEAGSALNDRTKPRFGASLSPGELDWVEWRINQFLGQATEADRPAVGTVPCPSAPAPLETVSDRPIPRPDDTKVRIEEDYFETRIYIPNGIQTRSLSGIGPAVFGLTWSAGFSYLALHLQNHRPTQPGALAICALFAFLGLLFLISGLTRLFGTRRLTITPERITYRISLLGIGPWQKLQTTAVLSCGLREIARRGRPAIAPAGRCVIRTADSELYFGEMLRGAECQWVASEVARRIDAARST